VYNLEVYQVHNYSVSEVGVLVHNTYNPKSFLDEAFKQQGIEIGDNYLPKFKGKWSDNGYDYEVRIHEAEAKWGGKGSIYRVQRQSQIRDKNGQGTGKEYLGSDGIWYHQSILKANNAASDNAAKMTHIPLPKID
jgi:hypothetical protein